VRTRHRKLLLVSATGVLLILAAIVIPFFHRIEFFGAHYAVFISGDVGNRTYLAPGFHYEERAINYLGPPPIPRHYEWSFRLGNFSLAIEMIKPTDAI